MREVMSTNYLGTDVPADKDPTNYTYVEWRADLLDRIVAAVSRKNIHQARLANGIRAPKTANFPTVIDMFWNL